MAFITAEQVKEKRNLVKRAFPSALGWKFSIKTRNYSCIDVTILESPIELRNLESKNISDGMGVRPNYDNLSGFGKEVIQTLWDIINKGNYDKSDSMTDYFDVGFYANIYIGKWDKPFEVVEVERTAKAEKALNFAA